jgi:hypothetical protein
MTPASAARTTPAYALYVQMQANAANQQITGSMFGSYYQVYSQGSNNITTMTAFNALSEHYGTGTVTSLTGMNANVRVASGGGNATNVYAFLASVGNLESTKTISTADSFRAEPPTYTGAITTWNALHVVASTTAAGTTKRGLYIENISGATNNYSIYSDGGTMYHVGGVGIGYATSAAVKLLVLGNFTEPTSNVLGMKLESMARETVAPNAYVSTGGQLLAETSVTNTQNWTNTIGMRAIWAYPYYANNTTNVFTVTGAAGLYISNSTALGNAALTNQYGIYIENLTAGANNYSIYTNTGDIRLMSTPATDKLGFWGATPIVRPSAYTQTYSTADKTHANFTSADIGAFTGGSTGFLDAAERDNVRTQFNALRADVADVKQLVNSLIDDLQNLGLLG